MAEEQTVIVRKALLSDVKPLLELINGYASQGIMLPRTEFELSENIRDFTVAVQGAQVVGCGALHFYGPKTGEIRSLAVHPERVHLGVGKRLMEALESEAAAHGLAFPLRLHLRPRILQQAELPGSRAAAVALQSLERLPALPEAALLRRDRDAEGAGPTGGGSPHMGGYRRAKWGHLPANLSQAEASLASAVFLRIARRGCHSVSVA